MSAPAAHALLGPSGAHRWLNCTPSARTEEGLPERTSEAAEKGRLAHSVCELLCRKKFTLLKPSAYTKTLKALKADPLWEDEMLSTAKTYVEHLLERYMEFTSPPHVAPEVRVDVSDYVPEAFGTCDCVMVGGDELHITDYKNGTGVPVFAEGNPQMRLYALGALKHFSPIYGDTIKRVRCYIDQPRLNSYSSESITVDALLAWGEEVVKPKAQAAFAGLGEHAPGEWCKFCRAKAQCRARADAHTALEDFKDVVPNGGNPLLSNAEIGDILTRGKSLVDWYNAVQEYALAAALRGEDIDGWKAVAGRSVRAWTDQDAAFSHLEASGTDNALLYERKPLTLAGVEKLLGKAEFAKVAGEFVTTPLGKPTLAPASDKRPVYNSAAADFAGV